MTRDELIEAMARAIHESMSKQAIIEYLDNPFDASGIATAALSAIEAAGLCIVPVEATDAQEDAFLATGLLESGVTGKSDAECAQIAYRAMISAGKL